MTRFCTALPVTALLALATPLAAQRAPLPTSTSLPAATLDLACAPRIVTAEPPMPLRLTGDQDAFRKTTFAPGDLVTINAGRTSGIEVGQEFFARRLQTGRGARISTAVPAQVRTAGWIRVHAVDAAMSLATVIHACDALQEGDYLEPFVLPQVPTPALDKPQAERDNYARVLTGSDRRTAFGRGDFFVIDRGSDGGVVPGAQFVVYRNKQQDGNFLFELGEAVAVDVSAGSATLQVTLSRDAFLTGDLVAQRR